MFYSLYYVRISKICRDHFALGTCSLANFSIYILNKTKQTRKSMFIFYNILKLSASVIEKIIKGLLF